MRDSFAMASMAAATSKIMRFQTKLHKNDNLACSKKILKMEEKNNTWRRNLSIVAANSNDYRAAAAATDIINGKRVNGIDYMEKEMRSSREACMLGKFVEERFVYRQTFVIRSYEIGPDKTATMETLMNLLQV